MKQIEGFSEHILLINPNNKRICKVAKRLHKKKEKKTCAHPKNKRSNK